MALADPRSRLAQLPPKALRKMYMPHTVPVKEAAADETQGGRPLVIVVNSDGGKSSLAELILRLVRG